MSIVKKVSLVCLCALVAFATFVGLRIATMDITPITTLTYTAPAPSNTNDINFTTNYGSWAAAVNSHSIATSKNTAPQPTASTAKMILALAVMEKKPFALGESGETITITQEYYNLYSQYLANNGSTTEVALGEEISEYDALTSVLLASSNNMSDTLAIWAFGSLENYRSYAQDMLARLGTTNTTIGTDACGHSETTTSTAADLALIGAKLLDIPILANIVATKSATVPIAGLITNTNKLLGQLDIVGIKTGYIGDASGYCLIAGYRAGKSAITTALLGAPTREQSFTDTRSLVQLLQNTIAPQTIITEGTEVGYIDTWWAGRVPITATASEQDVIYTPLSAELSGDQLTISSEYAKYQIPLVSADFPAQPTLIQRFLHVFGWSTNY